MRNTISFEMKILILLVLVFTSCLSLKAKTLTRDTAYKQTPDLIKFNGTWVYKNDNLVLKIVLKANKVYFKEGNIFMDEVDGYHTIIKNNKPVQTSDRNHFTITGGNYFYDFTKRTIEKNTVRFFFG